MDRVAAGAKELSVALQLDAGAEPEVRAVHLPLERLAQRVPTHSPAGALPGSWALAAQVQLAWLQLEPAAVQPELRAAQRADAALQLWPE